MRRARCWSWRSRKASSRRSWRHCDVQRVGSATLARVKVIVVGCGRVGSAVALELRAAGWDVAVIDEREEALGRLGDDWTGEFYIGHGMDLPLLREAGIHDAGAVVVATGGGKPKPLIGPKGRKPVGGP